MLKFNKNKLSSSDMTDIVDDYRVFLEDEEPILYSGTNKYGNTIIGLSIDDDFEKKLSQYLHIITDLTSYNDFLNRKLSLKNLILSSKNIYLLNNTFDNNIIECYLLNPSDINNDYLPDEESYCPSHDFGSDLNYEIVLHGKETNKNMIKSNTLSKIQEAISDLLISPLTIINKYYKQFQSNVFVSAMSQNSAYALGSFKINFVLEPFEESNSPLFFNNEKLGILVRNYFQYYFNNMPNELELLIDNIIDNAVNYPNLRKNFTDFLILLHINKYDDIDEVFLDEFVDSFKKIEVLTQNIGIEYDNIEFNNFNNPIAFLNNEFQQNINQTKKIIDKYQQKEMKDENITKFEIEIYNLNRITRKGNAEIVDKIDGQELIYRPKITIDGCNPLDNTEYTESIYRKTKLLVNGKATRIGNKIKHIEIIPE